MATSNAICRIQFESVPLTEADVLGGTWPLANAAGALRPALL